MSRNSRSYKISAFLLAFLMLSSSVGFSLDLHYCQGNFKNLAFFKQAESCQELAVKASSNHCKKMESTCHQKPSKEISKECEKNCCTHNTILIEADTDVFSAKIINTDFLSTDFIVAFVYSFITNYSSAEYANKYILYKPPLPDKDLSVLYQSFLI